MSGDSLTAGIVSKLCTGSYDNEEFYVQVIACKNVNGRFRVLLHDGVHQSSNAMLNSTYNPNVDSGEIGPNAILHVRRCNVTESNNSKFFAVLIEVEVVDKPAERIGNPIKWETGMSYTPPASNGGLKSNNNINNNAAKHDVKPPAQPPQQQQQQPQRSQKPNNSMNTSMATQANIVPISGLNPYQNKWAIKGRVIQKSEKRTWSNARGDGHLFSFEIQDESASLKVTAFKEDCDRIMDTIQEGSVYVITKGTLKPKDARYNKTTSQYEMTAQRETMIEPVDDDGDVPKIQFDFKRISDIENTNVGEVVDVIGIVKSCGEVATIKSKKDQRELIKRDLQLVDDSKKIISMTLWGKDAQSFNADAPAPIIVAARQVRIGDFQGKNLSTIGGTKLYINDSDIPECNDLRGWWDQEGCNAEDLTSLSTGGTRSSGVGTNWKCFKQTTTENMGHGDKPDYYSVKANVVFTKKDNALYQACPSETCNKKVQDLGNGNWRCEKCGKEFDKFKWRMMLQVNLADASDNCWATLFQESGEVLMGITAADLGDMKEENASEYDNMFAEVNFKPFLFRMRAKMETYNDETRLKTTVYEAKKFDPVAYGNILSQQIEELASKMAP